MSRWQAERTGRISAAAATLGVVLLASLFLLPKLLSPPASDDTNASGELIAFLPDLQRVPFEFVEDWLEEVRDKR